ILSINSWQEHSLRRRGYKVMSEKEKEIIETLAAAIPDMSEFDKGYLLGKGETIADMRRAEKKETEVVKA
ncbi:MAG: hypothetical protein UIK35_10660, partial [Coprococcus catus]|nr:hypothetical protein [Coprococcus catus]